ncbi:MAG: hypothetical protein K2F99_02960 [Muribaculaceae bacterium]|nr:hypothetical protein [Muribaculaceae bacterium]
MQLIHNVYHIIKHTILHQHTGKVAETLNRRDIILPLTCHCLALMIEVDPDTQSTHSPQQKSKISSKPKKH